jgi:hypothetical protein
MTENKNTENKNLIDNIFFSVEECVESDELDLTELLNEIGKTDITYDDDLIIPQIVNYHENYTVKELLLICEYYGVAKELKSNKCNKNEIIQFLVIYESNSMNSDIVFKRQNMWFYINELKNDKFMKKYVLW